MMYAILVPSALAGIGGPAIQSLISKNVHSQEQGELQGTLVSLGSLTAIIGPLFYTGLFSYFTEDTICSSHSCHSS
jgi:DHA1 family tetracycline resistance protein-like MFS transporter